MEDRIYPMLVFLEVLKGPRTHFYMTPFTTLMDLHHHLLVKSNNAQVKEFQRRLRVTLRKVHPETGRVNLLPLGELENVIGDDSGKEDLRRRLWELGTEAGDIIVITDMPLEEKAFRERRRSRSPIFRGHREERRFEYHNCHHSDRREHGHHYHERYDDNNKGRRY